MSSAEIDVQLEEALGLCRAGAFAQAEQRYRQLVASHPDTPDAWNMLAAVLYQQGVLDEAAHAAVQATQLRPAIAPYWLIRGNIEMARHAYGEAQASFRRAGEIEPAFAEAHYRLGMSLHHEFRYAEATGAYRQALRYAPDIAEIHGQLAEALVAQGRPEEALRAYEDAFARDPDGALDRRGCLGFLMGLRFDTLPAFWSAEINRIFQRADIDLAPYVNVGLNALKVRPGFRAALAAGGTPDGRWPLQDSALRVVLDDPLLRILLRNYLIADAEFEHLLTRLRARLLLSEPTRAAAPPDFLAALALQSFNNEFVFSEGELETAKVDEVRRAVEAAVADGHTLDDGTLRSMLVVAAYRPLSTLRGIDGLLASERKPPALDELFERAVLNVRVEQTLRQEIPAIGMVADAVSQAVRAMYEQHPYPRWFAVDREPALTLTSWLERELPALPPVVAPPAPRILVAGCGTGRDAIWLAANIANAQVLAVDLSLSSLAYAKRLAGRTGVANIDFRQSDILALEQLTQRFDVIASTGVLHHMRDPQAALGVLTRLLVPGGLFKIGLYSERARAPVNAARAAIKQAQLAPTEHDIRTFRATVLSAEQGSPLYALRVSNDFYSMSMCRDLLFHVHEYQYRLPQISAMLDAAGLAVLGLTHLPRQAVALFRRMFPDDPLMRDFTNWDIYEAEYPDTFNGMFHIWCRKAG